MTFPDNFLAENISEKYLDEFSRICQ